MNFISIARTSEIVDIGKIPTSCEDLHQMGQKISGIFLVKGSKKIEIIYCYFYPNQSKLVILLAIFNYLNFDV